MMSLILDEPVASLDDHGRSALARVLTQRAAAGLSVLIADHDRHWLDALTTAVHEFHDGKLRPAAPPEAPTRSRLTLTGPTENRERLMQHAQTLGFTEVD